MRLKSLYYSLFRDSRKIGTEQFYRADEIRFYYGKKLIGGLPLEGSAKEKRSLLEVYTDTIYKDIEDAARDAQEKRERQRKIDAEIKANQERLQKINRLDDEYNEIISDKESKDGRTYYVLISENEIIGPEQFYKADFARLFKNGKTLKTVYFPKGSKASQKRKQLENEIEVLDLPESVVLEYEDEEGTEIETATLLPKVPDNVFKIETKYFWRFSQQYSSHIEIRKRNVLLNVREILKYNFKNQDLTYLKTILKKAGREVLNRDHAAKKKSVDQRYLPRLATPMFNTSEQLLSRTKSGYFSEDEIRDENQSHLFSFGIGISRTMVNDFESMDMVVDRLFDMLNTRMDTYMQRSFAVGFVITGMSLETVVRTLTL